MTNQDVYNELKDFRKEFRDYIKEQKICNDMIIRHDEKIKSIWKIPVISGAIISFISAVAIFLAFVIK